MVNSGINRNRASLPLRILLVTSSPDLGGLVSAQLEADHDLIVRTPASDAEFIHTITTVAADIILADPALDRVSPGGALEGLRGAGLATPLIVLSESFDEQSAVKYLRAGAENLVLWSNLDRLRPVIDCALAAREPLTRLSPRQREVMRLVALGHSMRKIAERLGLSVKTVETHRSEVVRRLGIRNVAGLVRYAVGVGLIPPTRNEKRVA